MAKVFISDMDGTFLNEEGYISDYAKEKLEQLIQEGHKITFASARDYLAIKSALRGLSTELPVIECNGCYITDFKTGKKLMVSAIESIELEKIYEIFREFKLPMMVRTFSNGEEKLYFGTEHSNEAYENYRRYRLQVEDETMVDTEDIIDSTKKDQVIVINSAGEKKDIVALVKRLKELKDDTLDIHYMDTLVNGWYFLNIAHVRSNKGEAVKSFRENFLSETDVIYCFGDNYNDIQMFHEADVSVAVENAEEFLKEISDETIGSHQEDAVIKYIERMVKDES